MGNQQNLGPKVAERVFGAVFPSYGAVAQWERNCFASRRLWVRVPPVPLKYADLTQLVECHPYKMEAKGYWEFESLNPH